MAFEYEVVNRNDKKTNPSQRRREGMQNFTGAPGVPGGDRPGLHPNAGRPAPPPERLPDPLGGDPNPGWPSPNLTRQHTPFSEYNPVPGNQSTIDQYYASPANTMTKTYPPYVGPRTAPTPPGDSGSNWWTGREYETEAMDQGLMPEQNYSPDWMRDVKDPFTQEQMYPEGTFGPELGYETSDFQKELRRKARPEHYTDPYNTPDYVKGGKKKDLLQSSEWSQPGFKPYR